MFTGILKMHTLQLLLVAFHVVHILRLVHSFCVLRARLPTAPRIKSRELTTAQYH
ncbi:hypothetical protein BDV38DRAFT_266517 [Aspergillus pseudotamarii]|uniref:Uncharacterized protein n=1 Tax=Aspergillus pseudotamarii TaxID=132259 RepID=A0A5N6S818_ASPPS|nr:uncharacterized protein BDV38DRAFT_266517 [Aspergillus pseudotamarii]KAE8130715.1 hypothetical protein BDV38DRAFT_266517 [Aspergillus pseudotamarii]